MRDPMDLILGCPSRRNFLRGMMAAGASSVFAGCSSPAPGPSEVANEQAEAVPPRRIDVHQHFVSPDYHAFLTQMSDFGPVPGLFAWNDYTPERNLENMDAAGIETAMLSLTAPGVHFGDNQQARGIARFGSATGLAAAFNACVGGVKLAAPAMAAPLINPRRPTDVFPDFAMSLTFGSVMGRSIALDNTSPVSATVRKSQIGELSPLFWDFLTVPVLNSV